MKKTILLLGAAFLFISLLFGQVSGARHSALGTWLTTDDETGEVKSHILIFEKDGKQFGQVIKVLREGINHLCDKCEGHRKNQPVLGMVIIENMTLRDGSWQGGRVLFPKQGKWYDLKYWLQPGNPNMLVVRGNFGPFYRTQYWKRLE
ncbi:MAG: DUF2147 domain-containing protein [Saprospiraceae bacterium]|nr:DUF2147 domain-containing protein [Saprospiraceae bacterium]